MVVAKGLLEAAEKLQRHVENMLYQQELGIGRYILGNVTVVSNTATAKGKQRSSG